MILKDADLLEIVRREIRKRRLTWKTTLKKLRALCTTERRWWQQKLRQERLAKKQPRNPFTTPQS